MTTATTSMRAVSVAAPDSTGKPLLTRSWVKDAEHGGRLVGHWILRPAAPRSPSSAVNPSNRDDAHWDAICSLTPSPRDRKRALWGRRAWR